MTQCGLNLLLPFHNSDITYFQCTKIRYPIIYSARVYFRVLRPSETFRYSPSRTERPRRVESTEKRGLRRNVKDSRRGREKNARPMARGRISKTYDTHVYVRRCMVLRDTQGWRKSRGACRNSARSRMHFCNRRILHDFT